MGKEIFIVNSKLVEVNSIVDYDLPSIERLLELSRDEDWEIRCNAIEKISEFPMIICTDKIKERIRQGLLDTKKFRAALNKGIVGPTGESGIKQLNPPVKEYTHELKIGGSANRLLGYLDPDGILFCKFKRGGLH